jgi:hypothetical protein
VPGHRADTDLCGLHPDVAQLAVEIVDVDQVFRVGQPELHHRKQAVAAGEEPGGAPQPLQQPESMIDTGGTLVFQRGRNLHATPPCLVLGCPVDSRPVTLSTVT